MSWFKHHLRFVLVLVLIGVSVLSLFIGNVKVDVSQLLSFDYATWNVFFISRIPRTIAVILSGIGLSVSGLVMQKLAQNRFVSPSTAATQDSARLGIMLSLILFSSMSVMGRSLFAFIFAIMGTMLFMLMIQRTKLKNMMLVPLIGIMLGMVIEALTTFIALKYDVMQVLSAYMTGSFSLTIKGSYELLYLLIPAVAAVMIFASAFNIASLGEDFAINLGIHYRRVVNFGMIIVSFIDAIVITTIGTIPFVGLIIPNIVSLIAGDNLKHTLSITALFGAIFLVLVDIISRLVIFPYEVPISLIIGILGAVIFLVLIGRNKYAK